MSLIFLSIILVYVSAMLIMSYFSSRGKLTRTSFFGGEKNSKWYVVAISMIGTSISGVTFISVPGMVGVSQFSYMQMVLGFVAGYFLIAYILLPLYYKLNMYSIYGYLDRRYGNGSYKTGALYFLISKFLIGGVRMYLTALVLQVVLFTPLGIPFGLNVTVTMLVIWLYTFRGGVRSLIRTDMIQTLSMIAAVVLCIVFIADYMSLDVRGLFNAIVSDPMSDAWHFDDFKDGRFFWKQFLAGMFTTVAMTGLDQDMMQKNLSCRNLKEARKNVLSYGFGFIPVNLLFLSLGVLLYQYGATVGLCGADGGLIGIKSDELFPVLATGVNPATGSPYLPAVVGGLFVLGLVAAAFSSAGSALTALTTTVTVDMLRADRKDEKSLVRTRRIVHIVNAVLLGLLIYGFRHIGQGSVIDVLYTLASYTYGPLLGLYFFGLYTKRSPRDRFVPLVCILSPVLCYVLSSNSEVWFDGYRMGYELLLVNALLTMAGLWLLSLGRPALKQS